MPANLCKTKIHITQQGEISKLLCTIYVYLRGECKFLISANERIASNSLNANNKNPKSSASVQFFKQIKIVEIVENCYKACGTTIF